MSAKPSTRGARVIGKSRMRYDVMLMVSNVCARGSPSVMLERFFEFVFFRGLGALLQHKWTMVMLTLLQGLCLDIMAGAQLTQHNSRSPCKSLQLSDWWEDDASD